MFEKVVLTLEHPAVQEAKARWDAGENRRRLVGRHNIGFEEWFEYFKANCHRMSTLGEHAGISRERVRQIYNKHFRSLFGERSGVERLKACTAEQRLVSAKRQENDLFADPEVRPIITQALAAGCTVAAIKQSNQTNMAYLVRTRIVLINGYVVSLRTIRNKHKTSPGLRRFYAHATLSRASLESEDATIIRTAAAGCQERIFVLPNTVLIEKYFVTTKNKASIYLPLEKLPVYRNSMTKINWWLYENAWHLLPPKEYSSPASE